MATIGKILRQIPDPRGKQGRLHPLHALLGLIILSLLSGRKGMKAAFRLGRSLSLRQLRKLGFRSGPVSPCLATLTQLIRVLDPDAMARVFSQLTARPLEYVASDNQIAIDGKTLRCSKDADGNAVHVLSAFCAEMERTVGHASSRGKGFEIPDALKLLDNVDLKGKLVTGDAMFDQREITEKIVGKGGEFVFPAKGNQKDLRNEIALAFNDPVYPPKRFYAPPENDHGRIDQRQIAILPASALSKYMRDRWPSIKSIAKVERKREYMRGGEVTRTGGETVWLISSLKNPDPEKLLIRNRGHWRIEIMHRDKDVILGEDHYTNRLDHAHQNVFTLLSATRTVLKSINKSATRAIEMVQDKRNSAIQLIAGRQNFH